MATLIPSLGSCARRMTPGERRLAQRLEAKLEDDYLCWYDVPVGPKHLHPDFVVLHPGRGLLVLEVKDWRLDTLRKADRAAFVLATERGLAHAANPLEQARQYAFAVKALLERDPALQVADGPHQGKLAVPYGYGVALANITRKQFEATDLDDVLAPERVICQDEMTESVDAAAFQEKLWRMHSAPFQRLLTLPQVERIRWHLFPEIRIQQGTLALESEPPAGEAAVPDVAPDLVRVTARGLREGLPCRAAVAQRGVAIDGRVAGLELFDSAGTFACYLEKLVRSYALDAIETTNGKPRASTEAEMRRFLEAAKAAAAEKFAALGEGEDIRLSSAGVSGAALAAEGRLVRLEGYVVN